MLGMRLAQVENIKPATKKNTETAILLSLSGTIGCLPVVISITAKVRSICKSLDKIRRFGPIRNAVFVVWNFEEGQLIVVANGFQKKSQKTPKNEIELAKKIQKEYHNEKRKTK